MPPSQLKRLKASLREQGLTGPKSKKQKKQGLSTEQKIKRNAALENIRESFRPFEFTHNARPRKNDYTTAATLNGTSKKAAVLGRPGVSRSLGEQKVENSPVHAIALFQLTCLRDAKPCCPKCKDETKLAAS
jgi:nucleolar protein 14